MQVKSLQDHPLVALRVLLLGTAMTLLSACQTLGLGASSTSAPPAAAAISVPADDPLAALVGEFDDNQQVQRLAAQPATAVVKGKTVTREALPLRVHQQVRLLEHKNPGSALLLWQLQVVDATPPVSATWLFRATLDTTGNVSLLPYRALDPATIATRLNDAARRFEVQPNEWAELDACLLRGTFASGRLRLNVDTAACTGVLPTLGASAALLPLRIDADAEVLQLATFADQARGATAMQEAHRVRWFGGWAAINGAGPRATMESKDWHEQRNLRLHDEGGRLPVLWRDGSRSGYSIELAHLSSGSQTPVLKLALIEDESGRTLSYVWASASAGNIGMHLGWLQVGLELAAPAH